MNPLKQTPKERVAAVMQSNPEYFFTCEIIGKFALLPVKTANELANELEDEGACESARVKFDRLSARKAYRWIE